MLVGTELHQCSNVRPAPGDGLGVKFQRSRLTSVYANPLRLVHVDGKSRTAGEIKRHAARKGAAVVDHHSDRFSIAWVGHRHPRSESQGAMRGGVVAWIESLAAGGAAAGGIPGRDHALARARALRSRVGKEPREPAAGVRGPCLRVAQTGQRQRKNEDA